jgi:L-2-hydroxyglutarate oxidase LhgO
VNQGRYYDVVNTVLARSVTRPVYPVPPGSGDMPEQMAKAGGLGVHLTVDLDGGAHLGPDTEWLPEGAPLDYRADDGRRAEFLAAGRRLLPTLADKDIAPGQVGYRPKLHGPGEPVADFLIWHDRGYVHLGGIESPGLTASLAIAEEVAEALR